MIQYMSLYNILVIKLQSSKCPWWAGNCLSCVRSLRSYNWDAIDCAGRSWWSVWFGLYLILSNSSLSLSSSAAQIPADQAGRSHFACFDAETHQHIGGPYIGSRVTSAFVNVSFPWCFTQHPTLLLCHGTVIKFKVSSMHLYLHCAAVNRIVLLCCTFWRTYFIG